MDHALQFTPLDMNTWKRREIFYYFSQMAPTGYSITAEVDVSHMRSVLRAAGKKFFPAYLWLVTKTLIEQEEFKIAQIPKLDTFFICAILKVTYSLLEAHT